jgi:uncharacterized protein (DUF1501 family)
MNTIPFSLSMTSRREMLRRTLRSSLGLGLLSMLGHDQRAFGAPSAKPAYLTHPPKARRVIMIFLDGGLSHVDSFDHKPRLFADHGKTVANNTFKVAGNQGIYVKTPEFQFAPCGNSGLMISDLFPHLRQRADELCILNSMHTGHSNHFEAVLGMHTGSFNAQRPSMGSWVNYALGSECENLPGFVVLASDLPYGGTAAFSSDFLPGEDHGVRIRPGAEPVKYLNARRPANVQTAQRTLVQELNQEHRHEHEFYDPLAARIRSWEVAAGMQLAAPEVLDVSKEPVALRDAYGVNRGGAAGEIAWKCLVARRLVERGVRFVEVIQRGWDAHGGLKANHSGQASKIDQPVAALLGDLRQRGLLEDTLVISTTEFGRTPANHTPGMSGRDHHPHAFSSWLAGAGVKPGTSYGQTDDYGIHVAENGVHVHDFHATILHLLGIDHEKLTYRHAGRDYRLTDVEGNVARDILA